MYFYSYPIQNLDINIGLFSNAKLIFHGLACHVTFDSKLKKMFFLLAVPRVLTFLIILPAPPSFLGRYWLSGGSDNQCGYGFWHDFCETKLQWHKPSVGTYGFEKRWWHKHISKGKTSTYSFINNLIEESGNEWAKENDYSSWTLLCSTKIQRSHKFLIPNLYICYIILKAETAQGKVLRSSIRLRPNYHNDIMPLFEYLKGNMK